MHSAENYILLTSRKYGVSYFRNWFAVYGFTYWPVPIFTYYLYAAGLIVALFVKEAKELSMIRIFTGRPHTLRNGNIPHYNERKKIKMAAT